MTSRDRTLPTPSTKGEVDAFLEQVARTPPPRPTGNRGRLVFAMDATASREPSWDRACQLQGEMFESTAALGGLDVQLCYYRGFREFAAGRWHGDANGLLAEMTRVRCAAGTTQVGRVLSHVLREAAGDGVSALVFVGDCFEENIDEVCDLAGQLGLRQVPAFAFHEGHDAAAERAYREIARLTGGAYARFDAASAHVLRDLLGAVAVYAAGGRKALEDFGARRGAAVRALTHQMNGR